MYDGGGYDMEPKKRRSQIKAGGWGSETKESNKGRALDPLCEVGKSQQQGTSMGRKASEQANGSR
jgi:hypothetical protein